MNALPRVAALLIAATLPVSSLLAQHPRRIICWTEDNGQRACGDAAPPHVAAKERIVLNERGVVTQRLHREATAEERAALAAEQQRIAQIEAEAARRAAYDQHLLQTYRSEAELSAQYQRNRNDLLARRGLAEKSLIETRRAVDDLQGRVNELEKAGRPVPPKLAEQLAQFSTDERAHQSALDGLDRQIAELDARHERDLARYRELRAGRE